MPSTLTVTLADFLLARLADSEAEASEMAEGWPYDGGWSPQHVAWVLADCEAKRRIVGFYNAVPEGMQEPYRAGLGRALRCLALPYADHPDYDPDWRP